MIMLFTKCLSTEVLRMKKKKEIIQVHYTVRNGLKVEMVL